MYIRSIWNSKNEKKRIKKTNYKLNKDKRKMILRNHYNYKERLKLISTHMIRKFLYFW